MSSFYDGFWSLNPEPENLGHESPYFLNWTESAATGLAFDKKQVSLWLVLSGGQNEPCNEPTATNPKQEQMGKAFFVSHQWLANSHPDPRGEQLKASFCSFIRFWRNGFLRGSKRGIRDSMRVLPTRGESPRVCREVGTRRRRRRTRRPLRVM